MRRLIPLLAAAALLTPAAAAPAATMVRVTIGQPARELATLERLGFDVTENVRPGYADVVVYSHAEARRLRAAGFAFHRLAPPPAGGPPAAAAPPPRGPTADPPYRAHAPRA